MSADEVHTELVLVGGGHAHVQVLDRWRERPVPGVRLTVVVDRPEAIYSGMVPGWIAGDYEVEELAIDVASLAERAGARLCVAEATRIDPDARKIDLAGGETLAYDVASLDVGSTVRGLDRPGFREHALPTRPIGGFIRRLEEALAVPRRGAWTLRVAIIGGGVAGLEIAFTLEARLREAGRSAEITLLADPEIVPDSPRLARSLRRLARDRGVRIREPFLATRMDAKAVHAEGERCVYDLAVLATGAAPPALVEASPLPADTHGFVSVEPTLQVTGHESLFAVGDCASLSHAAWVPKAGVYAVRMGPVLDRNLRRYLDARARERSEAPPGQRAPRIRPLQPYTPQRRYLALLNVGDGRAIGMRGALRLRGRWVMRLKDRIDQRFMRRFRAPEGDDPREPRGGVRG